MREAINRLTLTLFGWIPDVSGIPPSRQVAIGGILAVLLHLLILFVGILISLIIPPSCSNRTFAPSVTKPPLEVELVTKPEPEKMIQLQPPRRQLIGSLGLDAPAEKPKDPKFESDRDMVAGAESPATGLIPLPSQEGRTDLDGPSFKDQDVQLSLSKETAPSTDSKSLQPTDATQPSPATAQPPAAAVTPLYAPHPVAKNDLTKAEKAAPTEELPEPAKPTHATPPPLQKVDKPADNQIAVTRPSPMTTPGPMTKLEPVATPVPQYARLSATPAPLPVPSFSRTYKEQLKKTRVEGMISNKGRNGIDQIATPAGRWLSQIQRAIGQNWNMFIRERAEYISTGIVRVSFNVTPEGRVRDIRVETSGGNQGLVEACLRAVRETPLPPPPPDLVAPLNGELIEQAISFNYYSL